MSTASLTLSAVTPTANVDGVLSSLAEARIPVLDRGFLYGDSVYEVFRTYDGVPLFWREHFDRLENSARLIHMPLSQSRDELMGEIRRTVAAALEGLDKPTDVYVRWHVSRGVGPVDLFPDPQLRTSYMIMVKAVPTWNPLHYTTGLRVAVTGVRRNSVESLSPNIKSGNYLNNILAVADASKREADDCLMLNAAGHVTEASNSNVFFVLDGQVVTPDDESGNLRGITGAALRQFGQQQGWPITERKITQEDLLRVTEAFVTSATREVMPLAALRLEVGAWRDLPAGGGELTRKIAAAYKDHVAQYVAENQDARLW
ncbi:aminotransferase class IV [Botrimarina hoheduenensis]|uniref:branched-chain-amino-acid transaminase n=1 Tax=Botrimarina hoheduenensis TaxID=2528000 RepID=A0A5C5VUZ7_9BACT|nr:aminotransferase class IV [Botrimarina hoheduenensis]TWT42466.1 Branched-chain-amino-acid aminotransferase [Botrimarina hoheduenensis]